MCPRRKRPPPCPPAAVAAWAISRAQREFLKEKNGPAHAGPFFCSVFPKINHGVVKDHPVIDFWTLQPRRVARVISFETTQRCARLYSLLVSVDRHTQGIALSGN